eukprot:c36062_g1_i1 orf=1-156(-)
MQNPPAKEAEPENCHCKLRAITTEMSVYCLLTANPHNRRTLELNIQRTLFNS